MKATWTTIQAGGILWPILIGLAAALIWVSCSRSQSVGGLFGSGVERVHDADRGVSCWTFNNGISCLPDSQVKGVPR